MGREFPAPNADSGQAGTGDTSGRRVTRRTHSRAPLPRALADSPVAQLAGIPPAGVRVLVGVVERVGSYRIRPIRPGILRRQRARALRPGVPPDVRKSLRAVWNARDLFPATHFASGDFAEARARSGSRARPVRAGGGGVHLTGRRPAVRRIGRMAHLGAEDWIGLLLLGRRDP